MEKTYHKKLDMWKLDTDQNHILHRIGNEDYPEIRHTMVKDPDAWEEISLENIPKYTKEEYKQKIRSLIAQRYAIEDEIAIIRQRDSKPEEFAEYDSFVESCKAEVKKLFK